MDHIDHLNRVVLDHEQRVEALERCLNVVYQAMENVVGFAALNNDVALVRSSAIRELVDAMTEVEKIRG